MDTAAATIQRRSALFAGIKPEIDKIWSVRQNTSKHDSSNMSDGESNGSGKVTETSAIPFFFVSLFVEVPVYSYRLENKIAIRFHEPMCPKSFNYD